MIKDLVDPYRAETHYSVVKQLKNLSFHASEDRQEQFKKQGRQTHQHKAMVGRNTKAVGLPTGLLIFGEKALSFFDGSLFLVNASMKYSDETIKRHDF